MWRLRAESRHARRLLQQSLWVSALRHWVCRAKSLRRLPGAVVSFCRETGAAAEQPLPYGRGSEGTVDNTRLLIGAATVRERCSAQKPSFATETSYLPT